MTASQRALSVRRPDTPGERAPQPKQFVMHRPVFALSIAFAIGLAIGAITKG